MSVTAGTISKVNSTANSLQAVVTAATAGTGPYTYQWYMSTATGFSPGGGNIISGATALTLSVSGLIPNVTYYLKNIATDTGASNATSTSAQLAIVTLGASQSPNAFNQSPTLGMIDLKFNPDTVAVQIDVSETGTLYAGSPVKIVDSSDGIPKVVKIAAQSDDVFGFINYNIKNQAFVAGMACEISMSQNVIYLYSNAAIARGARVVVGDVLVPGSVGPISGSGGEDIVGFAYDKATASGQLIRVKLFTPSFLKDGS